MAEWQSVWEERLLCVAIVDDYLFVGASFPVCFMGGVWNFVVLDSDHCLPFYLFPDLPKIEIKKRVCFFYFGERQVAFIQNVFVNVKVLNYARLYRWWSDN